MDPRCRTVLHPRLATGRGAVCFDWCSVGLCLQNGSRGMVADEALMAFWLKAAEGDALRSCEARLALAVQQAVWVWVDHLLYVGSTQEPPPSTAPYATADVRIKFMCDASEDPGQPGGSPDPEPPKSTVLPAVAPWLERALTGPPPGLAAGRFLRVAQKGDPLFGDYDAHIARAAYASMLGRVCSKRLEAPVVLRPGAGFRPDQPSDKPEGLPAKVMRYNRPSDLLQLYQTAGGLPALLEDLKLRYAKALEPFA